MTIQLDGIGRKLRDLPVEPIAAQDSSEGPVFVDESGRRSKKLRLVGWVLAAACACYAITLVAALAGGNSSAPWLPGLGQAGDGDPAQVEIQPAPTDRDSSAVTPHATPGVPAPDESADAVLPLPSGNADGSTPLPSPPAASSPAATRQPADGPAPGPATSPATPDDGASEPDTGTPSDAGPSEPAPGSGSPEPPVQESAA
ncbi:hypothetical protein ABZ070_09810 [Streptomyces sp. NPDC006283]|uniref:hypothetical protein n=1 Tax=Streptomyces sp. NPDC006283 TaxID=3156741 RepID=UPI0033A84FE1